MTPKSNNDRLRLARASLATGILFPQFAPPGCVAFIANNTSPSFSSIRSQELPSHPSFIIAYWLSHFSHTSFHTSFLHPTESLDEDQHREAKQKIRKDGEESLRDVAPLNSTFYSLYSYVAPFAPTNKTNPKDGKLRFTTRASPHHTPAGRDLTTHAPRLTICDILDFCLGNDTSQSRHTHRPRLSTTLSLAVIHSVNSQESPHYSQILHASLFDRTFCGDSVLFLIIGIGGIFPGILVGSVNFGVSFLFEAVRSVASTTCPPRPMLRRSSR